MRHVFLGTVPAATKLPTPRCHIAADLRPYLLALVLGFASLSIGCAHSSFRKQIIPPPPITFSCSNLPTNATCTFLPNPASLTPTAPISVVMVVQAGSPAGAGFLLPFGVLFAASFMTRRRWAKHARALLAALLLTAGVAAISGCGSANANQAIASTPKGSSTFTITATDGTTTQTATCTLNVD